MTRALVEAFRVSLSYHVPSARARSLRYAAANLAVGGRLMKDGGSSVYVQALRDLSFRLEDGDRLAIVGSNGSGKSSLLKVIAGVYEPTQGRMEVNGRVSSMLDIGHGLDMEATGLQNVRLLAAMRGYSPWRLKDHVERIVDFSDLGAFINMPVRTYSSGMLARLLFSVATAFDHDILLLEEWLSAGDENFVKKATARMSDVLGSTRVVVTATHSPDLVRALCNKVLILNHGVPEFLGSVDEYFYRAAVLQEQEKKATAGGKLSV
ncbi:ABC transporter ATP-binding protein [Caulobacter hibisci]|uniref:ABC transporter ATP-binding protein n=1 Tax=Caulobacter hibisci TaxID=2035993 RepID=A0ABS0SV63_9CAUL|nr:ABC transporter ATP-binding protein [Caulobacter hibisci]MBI1683286.1 ABC transporter ATP-binding protein [Caulobacter hibisci]